MTYSEQFDIWLPGADVTIVGLEGKPSEVITSSLYPFSPTTNYASSFDGMKERITIVDKFILKCLKL